MGTHHIRSEALTQLGGGDVMVRPTTSETDRPYFEFVVTLDDHGPADIRHGMTGKVMLPGDPETLSRTIGRKLLRFADRLSRQ